MRDLPDRAGGEVTDREAIIKIVGAMCDFFEGRCGVQSELRTLQRRLADDDLAEPAAPTVTREQAAWIEQVVAGAIRSRPGMGIAAEIEATILNYPAFFRAVADALEGE